MDEIAFKVACAQCNMREFCMPAGLTPAELERIDRMVASRRSVRRQETLFRGGDPFAALYAIRAGYFKTLVLTEDGREQVTGFRMAGELLGLDAIAGDRHHCTAVALEDSEICVLPFAEMNELSLQFPVLRSHVYKMMSCEIVRDQGVMLALGSMRAQERLATFLLNLVGRLDARGLSRTEIVLRMTREEIGSFLGLTLETVSRTFSSLAEQGILEVRQRQVRILDDAALARLVNPSRCH